MADAEGKPYPQFRVLEFPGCYHPLSPLTLIGNKERSAFDFVLAFALACDQYDLNKQMSLRQLQGLTNHILQVGLDNWVEREGLTKTMRELWGIMVKDSYRQAGQLVQRELNFRTSCPRELQNCILVLEPKESEDIACSWPGMLEHQPPIKDALAPPPMDPQQAQELLEALANTLAASENLGSQSPVIRRIKLRLRKLPPIDLPLGPAQGVGEITDMNGEAEKETNEFAEIMALTKARQKNSSGESALGLDDLKNAGIFKTSLPFRNVIATADDGE